MWASKRVGFGKFTCKLSDDSLERWYILFNHHYLRSISIKMCFLGQTHVIYIEYYDALNGTYLSSGNVEWTCRKTSKTVKIRRFHTNILSFLQRKREHFVSLLVLLEDWIHCNYIQLELWRKCKLKIPFISLHDPFLQDSPLHLSIIKVTASGIFFSCFLWVFVSQFKSFWTHL